MTKYKYNIIINLDKRENLFKFNGGCWAIYKYTNELSGYKAKLFVGETYDDVERKVKAWYVRLKNIELIDVADAIYYDGNEDDEDLDDY